MDILSLLRTMGALGVVLGLLAGVLWIVKRYNIRLPGAMTGDPLKRIALIDRTGLDARRSVALIRRDGREHLILLAPEGNMVIESGIIRDEIDEAAAQRQAAEAAVRLAEAEARAAAARAAAAEAQEKFRDLAAAVVTRTAEAGAKAGTVFGERVSSLRANKLAPAGETLAASTKVVAAQAQESFGKLVNASLERSRAVRKQVGAVAQNAKAVRTAAKAAPKSETPAPVKAAAKRTAPRLKVTDADGNIVTAGHA